MRFYSLSHMRKKLHILFLQNFISMPTPNTRNILLPDKLKAIHNQS